MTDEARIGEPIDLTELPKRPKAKARRPWLRCGDCPHEIDVDAPSAVTTLRAHTLEAHRREPTKFERTPVLD